MSTRRERLELLSRRSSFSSRSTIARGNVRRSSLTFSGGSAVSVVTARRFGPMTPAAGATPARETTFSYPWMPWSLSAWARPAPRFSVPLSGWPCKAREKGEVAAEPRSRTTPSKMVPRGPGCDRDDRSSHEQSGSAVRRARRYRRLHGARLERPAYLTAPLRESPLHPRRPATRQRLEHSTWPFRPAPGRWPGRWPRFLHLPMAFSSDEVPRRTPR